ncbi:MAG: MBL fold metallo-hydrolase, partial [Actinomycetes bacterium]
MTGGSATPRAFCVRADNPGPMTLEGTNTWLLQEPGSQTVAVVDPGPDDDNHWQAVADEVDRRGASIGAILLTHHHSDHSAGARSFARRAGCQIWAWDPGFATTSAQLVDGAVMKVGGCDVQVVASPGHSSDSVCFWIPADRALLTGDTILGRGTTVVA